MVWSLIIPDSFLSYVSYKSGPMDKANERSQESLSSYKSVNSRIVTPHPPSLSLSVWSTWSPLFFVNTEVGGRLNHVPEEE